jgi:hypothetical protein
MFDASIYGAWSCGQGVEWHAVFLDTVQSFSEVGG